MRFTKIIRPARHVNWYTSYAAETKEAGIVETKEGTFKVTICQTNSMALDMHFERATQAEAVAELVAMGFTEVGA